ncbi:MAG: chitobiase/beta-hexosaminidase C-terminal domain-containing protein [Steroidobacteraceae bacterium]
MGNSWSYGGSFQYYILPFMNRYRSKAAPPAGLGFALGLALAAASQSGAQPAPYGLASRIESKAYLQMPALADGRIPLLLSETGAFSDTAKLIPNAALIPYELIVPFWSDGAEKSRWVAVPSGKIAFAPTGEWSFPAGTVFVKTFEMPTDAADPSVKRRLETRLLVRDSAGGVYGVVYKWRKDGSDADLLGAGETEEIPMRLANGAVHRQTWYYPSRKDCLTCHTALAGGVLGVKTRQLNRPFTYPSGVTDNELRAWNHIGLFTPGLEDEELADFPALASRQDASRTLDDRARSYLDANCSQCHRPGGTVADFDARFDTPLDRQGLIDAPVLIDQGIDRPRVISPHDIWRSIAYMRVNTSGDIKMPPLARETIDQQGVELLNEWISAMPGRSVLAPPVISPPGGTYHSPIEVSLTQNEPGAEIHYTLDGSAPGKSDARYAKPIKLSGTAVLRVRAFKEGFTRSITEQQVFIVGK